MDEILVDETTLGERDHQKTLSLSKNKGFYKNMDEDELQIYKILKKKYDKLKF